ncbi:hypothetical protein A3Q56_03851 [Intoshia linei]|uniref:BPL/LPL catalytic domain-containing protein n=1 Tax=Intoshia linei TaxID=1819745 RepID=A0A177B2C1_9BILA|nr:hypothetical protein A3Q56_03851 [Intoshia linei]
MVKIMGRTLPVHIYTYQLPKDLECSLNSKLPYESNIMSPITEKQLLSGQWLRKASVMLIYNLRVCSFDLNNCIYNFLHRKNFLDIKSDGIISEKHPKTVICLRDKRMQDCKICCNKNCKSTFSAKLKNIDTRQDAIADTSSFNLNESYFILNDVKENEAVNLTNLLISQLEKFPKLQFKECAPKQIKTKSKMFLIDYKKELSNDLKELENCEESHLYDVMLGNECQMDQFHKFGFDLPLFLNSLHKKDKCPIICYADSVGSTLKISQNYFEKYCTVDTDILISANEQTCGVGRSSDKWISNRLKTIPFIFGTTSRIVKYACLIQHMLSCAIVESINSIINYDSGLRLKWPNDIYYKRIAKIGGVIVQAQSLVSSTLITSSNII